MATMSLIAELELLTHRARVRRVMELGRRAAAGDEGAAAILDELRRSPSAYERLLALLSVHGSHDGGRALEATSDPSRTVRRTASRMIALYGDDAQVHRWPICPPATSSTTTSWGRRSPRRAPPSIPISSTMRCALGPTGGSGASASRRS